MVVHILVNGLKVAKKGLVFCYYGLISNCIMKQLYITNFIQAIKVSFKSFAWVPIFT